MAKIEKLLYLRNGMSWKPENLHQEEPYQTPWNEKKIFEKFENLFKKILDFVLFYIPHFEGPYQGRPEILKLIFFH